MYAGMGEALAGERSHFVPRGSSRIAGGSGVVLLHFAGTGLCQVRRSQAPTLVHNLDLWRGGGEGGGAVVREGCGEWER